MQLIRWREANNLSLRAAAKLFEIKDSHLSRLERGLVWASPEVIQRVWRTTHEIGPEGVTAEEHLQQWLDAHPQESAAAREAGLAAAAAFHTGAKEKDSGSKGKRRGEAQGQKGRQKEGRARHRRQQ